MYLLLLKSNTMKMRPLLSTTWVASHASSIAITLVRTRGGHLECNLVEGGTCFLLAVTEILLPMMN